MAQGAQGAQGAMEARLRERIAAARQATLGWLATLQAQDAPEGVLRISAAHDERRWPGMLLPGTYNGLICRHLLDAPALAHGDALISWLLAFRRHDGVFRIPGMHDGDVFKKPDLEETWRYIDFHVTNYALGAIDSLDPAPPALLDFVRPWLDPSWLKAWLCERDLRDPWLEGNNIVNLGSFLLLGQWQGVLPEALVRRAFDIIFAWHERLQEPATGFWGVGQLSDARACLHAMAGSMHNFHLFYATGRELPYQDRAIDYALSRKAGIVSACIDVDLVDLLVHGHALRDHRRPEIRGWLRTLLAALLDFQNADGGFADEPTGMRRQDGWVRGYEEPQGISNTFSTWFRWIAIAMIAGLFWPGWRRWNFRRMLGIGYLKP
ncbi:MAG: hypothetical protein ACHQAY_24190 [Hyphomicrobiales bacterium]